MVAETLQTTFFWEAGITRVFAMNPEDDRVTLKGREWALHSCWIASTPLIACWSTGHTEQRNRTKKKQNNS